MTRYPEAKARRRIAAASCSKRRNSARAFSSFAIALLHSVAARLRSGRVVDRDNSAVRHGRMSMITGTG